MKTNILLLSFKILLSVSAFVGCYNPISNKIPPRAEKGILDLRDWDFNSDGLVKLDGEWSFVWKRFLLSKPEITEEAPSYFVTVPDNWNSYSAIPDMDSKAAYGYGTFSLKILLNEQRKDALILRFQDVGTAGAVWVDGQKLIRSGVVGTDENSSRPQYLPRYAEFQPQSNEVLIQVEVSNFHHFKGGIWETIRIGSKKEIQDYRENRWTTEMFLFGSITIMTFYHFGLFFLRRKDASSLYFGLFCLVIVVRLLTTGERFFIQKFPDVPWELASKLEYLSFYLAWPIFQKYMDSIFPEDMPTWTWKISAALVGFFSAIILIFPTKYFALTLIPFQIALLLYVPLLIFLLGRCIVRKRKGAAIASLGVLVLMFTAVNDILQSQTIVATGYYLPIGLFTFIFVQSYILSLKFSSAFIAIENLSSDLKATNKSYSRFVPLEFLKFLGKKNITEIELGDQTQKEMTILFSDIRSFTQLSEKMTPKDNFDFLNSYMGKMGPIIRKHGGFVDKYLGDGIMALFPDSPDNALEAAIEMKKELELHNETRLERRYEPIRIGIGIHTGVLMLGTIGEMERMDGTVISDAVNLASRIEGLTKEYQADILLSDDSYRKIRNRVKYTFKELGKVSVKGKENSVGVYEVV
ncbi:adenylate/guanylate cyclase domain-containing protein [Leptospira gomenensis]|uniref:Adenylate/guanylate cyclase domain-containing protein n=1 Tax=Leptospira gomenensis TaxID=2484974 RepID=A0A5F1Y6T8_9LEPT|nr:adenylate/guanylate cyclase domain-containing protein [Leptospira gomenensis]TGK28948.1 adenylate/guanylate cyclase domain-containing protein [Leptospira gomenensis]TGK35409.1 adenylate/guanylate cyclase domain-containing protein [Leptospira gomenensis]TGK40707.1 adenylate/guanylate cyclase domain-containing protein [Leptospira gomenensis]TGK68449.1 adenylate/guanylate cyclase domain-containing protein [Leptospira gomenensis]